MIIQALLTTLAVGTIWFWLLIAIASIIIIACVENEHYPVPSIVAILLGIIYWKTIVAVPWTILALVVGGFAICGAVWAVIQWFRRVQRKVAYFNEMYGVVLTESQMRDLKAEISPTENKALITGWIAFWPWDLFWTITGDFFNMIYEALLGVFQRISNRALGKFSLKPSPPTDLTKEETGAYRRHNG